MRSFPFLAAGRRRCRRSAATLMLVVGATLVGGNTAASIAPLELEDEKYASPACERSDERTDAALGLSVRARLSCGDRDLEQPSVTGLLVTAVHADKAAAQSGLQQGDVILGVDGRAVMSLDALQVALQDALNRPAFLLVARDDAIIVLAVPAL